MASMQQDGANEAGSTGEDKVAIGFEAAKIGLKQDGRGHVLTLLLHPNDIHPDLLASAIRTRYAVRMVELDDQDKDVDPKLAKEGELLIQKAGVLSKNLRFRSWLYTGHGAEGTEVHHAEDAIRHLCGIKSRAEFRDNFKARDIFKQLVREFESDLRSGRA